jgi:hypothetical protein
MLWLDMFRRNKGHYKEICSMKFCKMVRNFTIVCIFSLVICVHMTSKSSNVLEYWDIA